MTLQEKLNRLPDRPGVYLFKDVAGDVAYVGKAQSLRSRVRSYFQAGSDLSARIRLLVGQVRDLDFVVVESDLEAVILEFNLIQKHRPRFNVRYRDDKSYPYIRIDLRDPYPMLCVVRQRAVTHDGARYFGPYPSSRAMWQTIRLARRTFGICQRLVVSAKRRSGCTWRPESGRRQRPCLDYHVGRCLGPCADMVSQEEYREAVTKVCSFLEGKHAHVLGRLQREMQRAAEGQRFEAAARLRDQIQALEMTIHSQRVVSARSEDADVLGYALREDTGCLAVLQIREGRVVGQDHFLLEGVSGASAAEVVNEFAKQHYQKVAASPRQVLLPAGIEDAGTIEELLAARRGTRVHVRAPQRGAKTKLVAMAMENADHHLRSVLERESAERRRGEEAVADLQKVMELPVPPRRIEAFDISNVGGKQAVGAMIVFHDGHPRRSDYRRYRIRLSEGEPNDYEMMSEVLSRRLKAAVSGNVKFRHLPDLLLVDGGPGQLNVALRAMDELGLRMPAAGIAKEHDHLYLPGRRSPIALPSHSRALHLLQRVRDEAHRFAVSYHRSLRAKQTRESVLDDIPGVGPRRKQKLLQRFGGLSRLSEASADDIATAAGCGRAVAEAIAGRLRETESS
jgi:excinuclease ABC subunit C